MPNGKSGYRFERPELAAREGVAETVFVSKAARNPQRTIDSLRQCSKPRFGFTTVAATSATGKR